MPNRTTLALGPVSSSEQLNVELVQTIETPDAVLIYWRGCVVPSAFSPAYRFVPAALATIALFDQAMIEWYRLAEKT